MKVKRANNSLVLLWKQFWLYRNPKSFFGTPQGSLDHILKIVVLLILVGNAKISSQPFDYPPWEKTKSTHYVQHMRTHTHTYTHTHTHTYHTRAISTLFFSKPSLRETTSQNIHPKQTLCRDPSPQGRVSARPPNGSFLLIDRTQWK